MAGVIPPIAPGSDATGSDRSPYQISLNDFVVRFATSQQRATILEGLLAFRRALHSIGVTQGFQWIDGSFLEHIEVTASRPPNDVDVVTYAYLPEGQTQKTFMPILQPLLDKTVVKSRYKVDHYLRILPQINVRDVCYWYSLWSHRRDGLWKGYVEIPLDPSNDALAEMALASITTAGFQS
ncbi:DUF6932 family protein [Gluconobacter oxydans]|uniref:DUF6932 family protein n=1 Tax=Gluconobacter oxydans TaxID=442 RepID=UPI0039EADD66